MKEIHEIGPAKNGFAGTEPGKYDSPNKGDGDPDSPCERSVNHGVAWGEGVGSDSIRR